MEVHAVSRGWVLEWSGGGSASFSKVALCSVAGLFAFATTAAVGVLHRYSVRRHFHHHRQQQIATDNNHAKEGEPDGTLTKHQNPNANPELESHLANNNSFKRHEATPGLEEEEGLAMASDLPPVDLSGLGPNSPLGGNNSPRSRAGRGLETIGDMTVETFQRFTTVVGGVVKSPVVLMAKVGGLASPRALSSPTATLEERVFQLETQMKALVVNHNNTARTVVTELDVSPGKEKPRVARSLLQEMETQETLVKRVQRLEDRLNERMENIEKTLSHIQSQLLHLDITKLNLGDTIFQRQESLSGEESFHDADEQQSDNFDALESTAESLKSTATSPPPFHPDSALVDEKSGLSDPLLASTSADHKQHGLGKEPDCGHGGGLPAPESSQTQVVSTLEELHGALVKEPSAAAASAKLLEIVGAENVEEGPLAGVVPSAVFSQERARETVLEKSGAPDVESEEPVDEGPHATASSAGSKDIAQSEDVDEKSGAVIAAMAQESASLPCTFEESQEDFATEEPLGVAKTAAAEGALEEDLGGGKSGKERIESSEPGVGSEFVEEVPLAAAGVENASEKSGRIVAVPDVESASVAEEEPVQEAVLAEPLAAAAGADSEEPAQEDVVAERSDRTIISGLEGPSLEEPRADFNVKVPLAVEASAKASAPAEEDDSSGNRNLALASGGQEPQEALAKQPSGISTPLVEESAAHETGGKESQNGTSGTLVNLADEYSSKETECKLAEDAEVPAEHTKGIDDEALPSESKELEPGSVAAPDIAELQERREQSTEEGGQEESGNLEPWDSVQDQKSFEAPRAPTSIAELARKPAQERKELEQESLEQQSEEQPVQEPAQEDRADRSGVELGSSEPQVAPEFVESEQEALVEEPSVVVPSAKFVEAEQESEQVSQVPERALGQEPAQEDPVGKSGVLLLGSAEPQLASKSVERGQEALVEEPSTTAPSAKFVEPVQEESAQEPEQQSEEQPPVVVVVVPEQESGAASSEPQVASKFIEPEQETLAEEEPSVAAAPGTKFEEERSDVQDEPARKPVEEPDQQPTQVSEEEPAQAPKEERAGQSEIALAFPEPQVASKSLEPREAFAEEPSAATPSAKFEDLVQEEPPREPEQQPPQIREEPAQVPSQEPAQEGSAGKSGVAQVASKSLEPREALAEEPSAATPSAKFEDLVQEEPPREPEQQPPQIREEEPAQVPSQEPAQEGSAGKSGVAQVASKSLEPREAFAEEPSAATPSAKFEDPVQEEPARERSAQHLTQAPLQEPLAASPSAEPKDSSVQERDSANVSDDVYVPLEPQLAPSLEESKEAFAKEPVEAAPEETEDHTSTDDVKIPAAGLQEGLSGEVFYDADQGSGNFEPWEIHGHKSVDADGVDTVGTSSSPTPEPVEPGKEGDDAGKNGDNVFASSEPQSASTSEEAEGASEKEPLAKLPEPTQLSEPAELSEPTTSSEPAQLSEPAKSSEPTTSSERTKLSELAKSSEPTTSSEPAQLSEHAKSSEPTTSSEPAQLSEIAKSSEPTTSSEPAQFSEPAELPEPTTSFEPAQLSEPAQSSEPAELSELAKLSELFKQEDAGPLPPATEEPHQKPHAESLASAKSLAPPAKSDEEHARKQGSLGRSNSEPQFVFKHEEESSQKAAATPASGKLEEPGPGHEDFADTQCLPFRLPVRGEGKHARKESEFKSVEDVKSPARKLEAAASYVLSPRPSKIKEKKRKDKKQETPPAEEKGRDRERRYSLGPGDMDRKLGSLRGEEKGSSKHFPRPEDKHKPPFKHWRDRLRHAFSVNKDS